MEQLFFSKFKIDILKFKKNLKGILDVVNDVSYEHVKSHREYLFILG